MRKLSLLLALLFLSACAFGQISDITGVAALTSTCSNASTTCDTAGVTNFNINSSFSVLGPQTIEVTTQGYGLATVSVTGTYSGSTLNFEFSDDGGTTWYATICTRTDANIQEASEALPANQTRAWDCAVGAATKFRVRQSAFSSGSASVRLTLTTGLLEPAPTVSLTNTIGANDPCQNPGVLKSSVVITISSTTAVELVAAVAGKTVYACGFSATIQGSATTVGTVQFETGTKVTNPCDTSTATRTGVYAGNITASVPTFISSPPVSGTAFSSISGGEICAVSTGTTIAVGGILTFVQQ